MRQQDLADFRKKCLHFLRTCGIISKCFGRLVKRLRRRPLTAETGVRFPYLLLRSDGSENFIKVFKPYVVDWSSG